MPTGLSGIDALSPCAPTAVTHLPPPHLGPDLQARSYSHRAGVQRVIGNADDRKSGTPIVLTPGTLHGRAVAGCPRRRPSASWPRVLPGRPSGPFVSAVEALGAARRPSATHSLLVICREAAGGPSTPSPSRLRLPRIVSPSSQAGDARTQHDDPVLQAWAQRRHVLSRPIVAAADRSRLHRPARCRSLSLLNRRMKFLRIPSPPCFGRRRYREDAESELRPAHL